MKIYIDGKIVDKDSARIGVLDHGLLYGDGVFEGIRFYGGRIFKLGEHVERLFMSAHAIALDPGMSRDEIARAIEDTVAANGLTDGYIRAILTRGEGSLGLDPASCPKPCLIIIVAPLALYPAEFYEKGIAVVSVATRRSSPDALEPRIKSLNYLNNIMAKMEAKMAGCLEALMLNREGYVAECTADNVFIVKHGRLLTPPPYQGALDGITMRTVLDLAKSNGIDAALEPMTRYDLYTADECFLTGTGAEIIPVIAVDGRSVGNGKPGPLTLSLRDAFRKFVYSAA